MESPKDDDGTEIFDLVRNLGPPPSDTRATLSINLTIAETRLAYLQRQHDELVKEMNQCRFTINAIKSLHSPWRCLPAEILAEIFSHCMLDKKSQRPCIRKAPLTLTQVCSTWYRIVTDIPHLWTSIVLISDLPYLSARLTQGTEYLRACTRRSKNDPLELHLSIHFIAYRPSYDLLKQYSHQISAISFHYPQSPNAPGDYQYLERPSYTWFHHGDPLILPNLHSLEIQDPNQTDHLSDTDFTQLRMIADSARYLRRYMFHKRLLQPNGPVLTNWTYVTNLTLMDPTPVALLSHILRNAPLLRTASFNCLYESLAPTINTPMQTMLSNPELTMPFTHDRLQTLLISYGDSITLESLFNLVTLPSLEHILFEKWSEDTSAWAQQALVSFLQRSRCSLKVLNLNFIPVKTAELIEILEVPTINVALRELMIQNEQSESEKIIDADLCELLTLPPRPSAGEAGLSRGMMNGGASRGAFCPNLEVLGLLACHSCSTPALVRMLRSRLDRNFQFYRHPVILPPAANVPQEPAYLKYFETDVPLAIAQQHFKPLLYDGLVTLLYDSDMNILPATEEERRLLRRFAAEGLQLWEYDPVQGTWGPTDFWT